MPDATVEVRNPSGLHARPAAIFVKAANQFASEVRIANLTRDAGKDVSAGSLLAVLALGVSRGHQVRITADGEDAEEAIQTLTGLIESGLGEEIEPGSS
jgi:phosphotransferase system HPr (HPr) family protein